MGADEIRVRLGGIGRQRVYQITSRPDFPKPAADLVQGNVWLAGDVDAWITAKRPQLIDPAE
jgi:prophage regulatory protein